MKRIKPGNRGRLFGIISIEATSVRAEEFNLYTANFKAAEAFSKIILTKSEQEVVDLLNKIKGMKLKVSDFSGNVKISSFRNSLMEVVFKVCFELAEAAKKQQGFTGPVEITLVTRNDVSSVFSNEFEYQGARYFIE